MNSVNAIAQSHDYTPVQPIEHPKEEQIKASELGNS